MPDRLCKEIVPSAVIERSKVKEVRFAAYSFPGLLDQVAQPDGAGGDDKPSAANAIEPYLIVLAFKVCSSRGCLVHAKTGIVVSGHVHFDQEPGTIRFSLLLSFFIYQ